MSMCCTNSPDDPVFSIVTIMSQRVQPSFVSDIRRRFDSAVTPPPLCLPTASQQTSALTSGRSVIIRCCNTLPLLAAWLSGNKAHGYACVSLINRFPNYYRTTRPGSNWYSRTFRRYHSRGIYWHYPAASAVEINRQRDRCIPEKSTSNVIYCHPPSTHTTPPTQPPTHSLTHLTQQSTPRTHHPTRPGSPLRHLINQQLYMLYCCAHMTNARTKCTARQ